MKVLITGSSGVLGHSLVSELAKRGDQAMRLFDMVPPPASLHARLASEGVIEPKLDPVMGDMRDRDALLKAADGCEVIYHLAAGQRMKPQFSDFTEEEIFSMNLDGVRNVLDVAKEAGTRKVVFISSSAVYGLPQNDLVKEDEHQLVPLGAYGESKLQAEGLCEEYLQKGVDVTMLRPMSLFGDGMTGVFVMLFDWVRRGRRCFLLGRGENRVQMVSADDVANACYLAATTPDTCGLIANIGSAPETVPTVVGQVKGLIRHAGADSPVTCFPASLLRNAARFLNIFGLSPIVPEHYLLADATFVLDISRAREKLGWEPTGDNIQITCDAYDWYLKNWEAVAPKPNLPLKILEALT